MKDLNAMRRERGGGFLFQCSWVFFLYLDQKYCDIDEIQEQTIFSFLQFM